MKIKFIFLVSISLLVDIAVSFETTISFKTKIYNFFQKVWPHSEDTIRRGISRIQEKVQKGKNI